jgi:Secretion system C-terminal sorting domain
MKKTLLTLLFIASILRGGISAQNRISLSLTPSAQTRTASKDSFEVVLKAKIKNNSPRQKTVTWTRTHEQITMGWASAVCDKNACWATRVDTQPLILAAGEESNLDAHVYPNGINGGAIVRIRVVDNDSAANNVTGRYGFNLAVSVKESANAYPDISIYPNPSPQYFLIKDDRQLVSDISIFTVAGNEIMHLPYQNAPISVANLANGAYFVTLFDAKGQALKVLKLVK